jgi:hypothetical protein
MRLGYLLLFLLLSGVCLGQKITISGRVLDAETKEPLPFASIGIKGKSIGTITNLAGEFDFHIPDAYRNDILIISMLSYNNFEAPVWSLLAATNTISLKKSVIILNEILVEDSLKGGDILYNAMSKIEQNYAMQPFMMDGFYRDIKKVGGSYISLLEAAVKIYDENYAEPRNKFKLHERVRLMEVRRSLGYESQYTSYFDQVNLLEDLLLKNSIRYRRLIPEDGLYYKLIREKDSEYNGRPVYVITHSKYFSLKLFIDKEDFSIIRVEFIETKPYKQITTVDKKRNLVSKYMGSQKVIDFKKVDGKMYLNYITSTSKLNWYDPVTNELKLETELQQQLLINEVAPNTRERIKETQRMRNYGLQYQDQPYNKDFWKNYNVIKESPLDKKIMEDLEKVAPLDKQFEGKY